MKITSTSAQVYTFYMIQVTERLVRLTIASSA